MLETRTIGSLRVSLAGLGCNNFGGRCDRDRTTAVVSAALDVGVTFFDTADIYGGTDSERFLGAALKGQQVVIATKFGHRRGDDPDWLGGASAAWIERACEASLRRLGVDTIDLYQQHIPDDSVPIDETLDALGRLVQAGKVREIGHSNFSAEQIGEAHDAAKNGRFVSAQNRWSLLWREPESAVIPACRERGIGMLPYFPLASGMLTGKYHQGEPPPPDTRLGSLPPERSGTHLTDEAFAAVSRLQAWAADHGRSVGELAIAWLASHDVTASVIAGATTPEQVRANAAATSWRLSPEQIAEVAALVE